MKNLSLPILGSVSPVVLLALGGVAVFALMNTRVLTRAAVGVVDNTLAGAVEGLGQVVGVPITNKTQCQRDIAAGKTLASSFSCPAGTWLASLWD